MKLKLDREKYGRSRDKRNQKIFCKVATEWRSTYNKDVVIDLVFNDSLHY